MRDGCQIRRVRFHHEPIEGSLIDRGANIVRALEGNDSADGQVGAALDARRCFIRAAGEAVKHGARRGAFTIEHVEGVLPRGPGVDHQRKLMRMGQRNLLGEDRTLLIARRMIVVIVKAGLADRDHLRVT